MDFKDCVDFANDVRVCFLATNDNGQPRVRALGMWYADETGFYLQTSTMKDLYRQLKADPRVELCFWKAGEMSGKMLRVAGNIDFIEDKMMKAKCIADRPFLKSFGLTADSPELIIFKVGKGEAYFWTMQDNFKPRQMIRFG
jgi:pyridoxamine 5'-phosphate oxidase